VLRIRVPNYQGPQIKQIHFGDLIAAIADEWSPFDFWLGSAIQVLNSSRIIRYFANIHGFSFNCCLLFDLFIYSPLPR
jgi:hypothetical protein